MHNSAAFLVCAGALVVSSSAYAQAPKAPPCHGDSILPWALPVMAGDPLIEQPGFCEHEGCGKARMWAAREALDEESRGGFGGREAYLHTDVLHNNLDFEIFPSTRVITGSNTMTIKSMVDGLTEFTFNLRSNYTVSTVVLNGVTSIPGSQVPIVGTYARRVTLDRPYNAGEVFTLRVNYSGTSQSVGFGSIVFTTMNSQTYIGTLSEPYYAASWWPCKDGDFGQPGDNSDKATLEIAITAPNNLYSASNGVLQGIDQLSGNRARYRWRSDYPIATYLVCFGSHPYNVYSSVYNYPLPEGGQGQMPFIMYISPGSDTASNRNAWSLSIPMMAAFRPYFGEYPFVNEKYGVYQFTFSGGMEHQTISGMGGFGESVKAHELGHQWFGDAMTCRTWSDIWLNEGFATFSECLWAEKKPGSSGMPAYHAAINARRPNSTGINSSVYKYDTSSTGAIFNTHSTYYKGAWVVHQLRHVAGDSLFFQTLANYRAAFEGSAATTDDFAAIASATLGRDMTQFFAQWVYGTGAPAYAFGWQSVNINGQNYLRLRIRQTQSTNMGANQRFEMPIDVRVVTGSGTQTYVVENTARTQWFLIPINAGATGVTLDPDVWILNTAKTSEAYVAGPPKVISTSPALGAEIEPNAAPSQVSIGFSDNVSAAAANFTVAGPSGSVPFTHSFDGATWTSTLSFDAPLPPGAYTVTVSDSVTAGGLALDGEIADPNDPLSLPSGNGLAGGAAVFGFTIIGCPADFNGDGQVDFFDYLDFVVAFDNEDPEADFNGDGQVDFFDYLDFISAFDSGC